MKTDASYISVKEVRSDWLMTGPRELEVLKLAGFRDTGVVIHSGGFTAKPMIRIKFLGKSEPRFMNKLV